MAVVMQKLVNLMGEERGRAVYLETLERIKKKELASPDDNLRFADELISRGGVLASVGRSIKIQAILHGARASR